MTSDNMRAQNAAPIENGAQAERGEQANGEQANDDARACDGTPASNGAPAGPKPAGTGAATVTVHPHGELTAYFGRVSRVQVPITPGMTIAALLDQLGVPAKEVWVHALNGETVKPDAVVNGGDSLELFSPVAGG